MAAPLDFAGDVAQTRLTVYMGFVSFMILVWEHIITFDDEVQYIWKGNKGLVVWLFFLNRYLTPAGFIINLFAYLSPTWTQEGSMTVIGLNTTALLMFLRVYALYPRQYLVLGFVATVFCIELGVNAFLLTHGVAVTHEDGITACTMIFDPDLSWTRWVAPASAWLPLLYDTIVFILVVFRTLQPVRKRTASRIMKVLLRDGFLYYSVIFCINLVLTLMIALAPPGLKNITAQMELLLTVAMMSRITLHLKKQGRFNDVVSDIKVPTMNSLALRSHLRFTRSQDPAAATHCSNPQVTVIVEELVTRDNEDSSVSYTSMDHSPRAPVWNNSTEEWHEMKNIGRFPV